MLRTAAFLGKNLAKNDVRLCGLLRSDVFSSFAPALVSNVLTRTFGSSSTRLKEDRKRWMDSLSKKKDEGTEGERFMDVAGVFSGKVDNVFPDENTPNVLYDGVKFSDLPICKIRVSKNNTLMVLIDSKVDKFATSCGKEGFKNAKKGTNVAAQATAISFGTKAAMKGYKNIRVLLAGLGPGRASAVKGLQMAGLNIVSITDNTPISYNPPRARKVRRL